MAQYVMSMLRVSKIVPPKRQIIKDISLSFFPGAKIGLLGLNGSGKSTVLRIMAGVDKEYDGEVQHLAGVSIGYLPQEPQLDPEKTVREEVESALGEVMQAQAKLDEVYAAYADPKTPTSTSWPRNRRAWKRSSPPPVPIPKRKWNWPPTRCACRPGMPTIKQPVRRRKAPGRAVQAAARPARHAAARRADQPPRRRIGRMAGAVPRPLPRHGRRRHPRPLLPRQRRRMDSRTRPRPRHSVEGQLLELAGAEGSAPGNRKQADRRPHEGDEAGTGMGAQQPEGAPGQVQVPPRALRGNVQRRIPEAQRNAGNLHSGRRAPGRQGHRVQRRHQVLRRQAADGQPEFQRAGRRHRRHHRPQRRR